jgi:hypothetical protein
MSQDQRELELGEEEQAVEDDRDMALIGAMVTLTTLLLARPRRRNLPKVRRKLPFPATLCLSLLVVSMLEWLKIPIASLLGLGFATLTLNALTSRLGFSTERMGVRPTPQGARYGYLVSAWTVTWVLVISHHWTLAALSLIMAVQSVLLVRGYHEEFFDYQQYDALQREKEQEKAQRSP